MSFKKTSLGDVFYLWSLNDNFLKVVVMTFKKSSLSDNICNVIHRVIAVDCACWHNLTVTVSLPCTLPTARGQQNMGKRCHPGLFLLTSHHRHLPTMSNTPPPPITTYWTTANRAFFIDHVKAGCININDTTPAVIDAIRNKYWRHKSLCPFCINYRKVASDLQVERHVHGGRGTRMSSVLLHDHTPLSLIFLFS
jgi:hypothetical protein